jgi:hypothetical protein
MLLRISPTLSLRKITMRYCTRSLVCLCKYRTTSQDVFFAAGAREKMLTMNVILSVNESIM